MSTFVVPKLEQLRNIMQKFTELLFILLIPSFLFSQKGPAGVGDASTNSMWLKANQGTSSIVDNTPIDNWNDCSGNNIVVNQTDINKRPYFASNFANGYAAINFDKTTGKNHVLSGVANNLDGTAGLTIFSVVKKIGGGKDARSIISKRDNVNIQHSFMFFFYENNTLQLDIEGTNNRLKTAKQFVNGENLIVSSMFNGSLDASYRSTIYEGNTLLKTAPETSSTISSNNSPVVIGATNSTDNRPFEGLIAEVITYRIALNETQRTIVNNYLSAKYNIPLTDQDLYTMDNIGNGNFDHEVAGIGSLSIIDNHLVAQGSGIVEISNASNLAGKFLIWGHNNATQQAVNVSDVPAPVEARFDRTWRVSSVTSAGVAANVGTVSLQFDLSNLGSVNPTDLRLLISSTGSFASTTPIAGAVHVFGNLYRFDGVNLQDANYFTLGTINPIVTPLPITLLDFTAEKEGRKVLLNWSTASEENNDRFEIEKTNDGINWEIIQSVKGNNHTNGIVKYTEMDKNPFSGTNYYRLKQIDYNGEFTLSAVRSVLFNTPAELTAYPNPANQFLTINRGENATINLINELGQIVLADQEISKDNTIFNLSNLNPGIYFVRIQEEDEIVTKKIIVNHD